MVLHPFVGLGGQTTEKQGSIPSQIGEIKRKIKLYFFPTLPSLSLPFLSLLCCYPNLFRQLYKRERKGKNTGLRGKEKKRDKMELKSLQFGRGGVYQDKKNPSLFLNFSFSLLSSYPNKILHNIISHFLFTKRQEVNKAMDIRYSNVSYPIRLHKLKYNK